MSRRPCLLSALLVTLAGCGPRAPEGPDVAPPPPEPSMPASSAAAGGIQIAVIPKAVSHEFWTTVKAGAEAAAAAGGATIVWRGPDSETQIDRQKAILEDAVTQGVKAVVLAACDAEALVDSVQAAEQAGVPVITIDSGLAWDGVRSLVATDNVAAAKQGGETLFKLLGGKGEVGLIPFVKGAASSEDREQGFKEALAAAPGIKLVATRYSESDVGKAKSAAEDMLTSQPNLAGIFAANEPGAIGAANALNEMGKAGKVKLVGYDGSPTEVELLKAGVIQALVVQDPYKMGFQGVEQALAAIAGKAVEKRVDTGVVVITKENLETPQVQKLLNPSGAAPKAAAAGK
ncbi:MAG: ABC transporter substrate-binding protein [Fimbriimonadaceae bacterium]|nr:ABC transporter substrate-binding protein [Fimbriimonadaceae bacterium]